MTKPSYRVIGPHRVLDHSPGDTFTKHLDPDQERLLIEAGHIEIVTSDTTPSKEK